jgi:hypothetical protein
MTDLGTRNAEINRAPYGENVGLADPAKLNVVFVLPNLQLKSAVETNYVGILPSVDPRVIEIAKRSPAVDALINNFSDHHGSKISGSVMVLRQDSPKSITDSVALVSFRNIVAMSCVLQSWQFSVGSPNAIGMLFSDYFDFYPYSPTRDGKKLLHIGHGLNALDAVDDFLGQPYPELSRNHLGSSTAYDEQLFDLLRKAWIDRFEKRRKNWKSNRLFRSLAIAYHACALPKKNSLWFYDFGVSVALWISAFEALVHPGRGGKADLSTVLSLISKARFSDPVTKRRRKIISKNATQHGNAAQYLYWRLYESRNAFLHGNPVTIHDALFKNRHHPSLLTTVVPLVFSVTLLCYFDWYSKPSKDKVKLVRRKVQGIETDWKRILVKQRLEKALKHILTGKDRRLI